MTRVCIVGLGYAGLPLAVLFGRAGHTVTGYDIDERKVQLLQAGIDPLDELGDDRIADAQIDYSTDPACIGRADVVVVAVPTPVTEESLPDLGPLRAAATTIGEQLRPGATVVLESTIHPGGTQEELVPALEAASGMTAGVDFTVGYSPERIVPGESFEALTQRTKLVSGQDDETLDRLSRLYGTVFQHVHRAPTIETAEAAKCLENTQRDVNIALVNEFAMACSHVAGLDYEDVLAAAETKWNFHSYHPGLVGGHCIPVDPYYLIHRLEASGFVPELIRTARTVNERLPTHVTDVVLDALAERRWQLDSRVLETDGGVRPTDSVLVAGLTYKPNSSDVRSDAVKAVVDGLQSGGVSVVGYEPYAPPDVIESEFGIPVQTDLAPDDADALVVCTPHDVFRTVDLEELAGRMRDVPVVVDVPGVLDADPASDSYIYRRL